MLIGELIFGDQFFRELAMPHSDPVVREMEESTAALIHEVYSRALSPVTTSDYYGGFFGRLIR